MRLDKILENIKATESAGEKTAAEKTAGVAPAREQLLAALNEVTASTKVASAAAPVDDLMKIASAVAATEGEMAIKEAQILGRAFADSVISRVGEWQAAASSLPATKVASHEGDAGFDKFASENPDIIKQAAELGYTQTREHLEKVAAAEYEQGYNETMAEVQKLAAEEFAKAALVTDNILTQLGA